MATTRPASLARRALPMLVIAGAAGGLLVKLDNPASSSALPVGSGRTGGVTPGDTAATEAPVDTAADTPAATVAPTSSTATLPRTTPTTVKGSVAPPTTSAAKPAGTTAVAAAAASAAGSCGGTPLAGPTVSTRWGPVQVAALFDGAGSLCDVKVLQYPSDHSKSVRINQRALPILRQEVLAANGTDINIVTGATITSDAYAQSLQAILDNR